MLDEQDILVSDDILDDPGHVQRVLARRVEGILHKGNSNGERCIVRLIVPMAPLDAPAWLAAQTLLPKVYWHARRDSMVTAAVGEADRCMGGPDAGYGTLRTQLDAVLPKSDARARYFGGFRFDPSAPDDEVWQGFPTFLFTLPRFAYLRNEDRGVLACNLFLPRDLSRKDAILEDIEQLRFPDRFAESAFGARKPLLLSRTDEPDRADWEQSVEWALDAFAQRRRHLEKVVLARRTLLTFGESLDAFALLKKLREATPNCFHYGFQFEPDAVFVGATPERLFHRSGRYIRTEAVAGTCVRGDTEAEDAKALASLLASEKDQREHAYVRESIRTALDPLCQEFRIDDEASGLQQAWRWHLVSRSSGLLQRGVHGSDVMGALHPTPAVGGYPVEPALAVIRNLEGFDRGWYTGPVGWIGPQGAEFAVALRCGLVRDRVLYLFAGAGIVEGSDPAAEWTEIEQKISDILGVLG